MSVELMVQPPFGETWTDITIKGDDADEVLNIIVSRFIFNVVQVSTDI